MGIFDGYSMPWEAADNGWGETRVTPGAADAGNLSLAERIRATLTGSTNPSPQAANAIGTAGKMFAAASPKPSAQPQAAAPAPAAPPKPGIDPQVLASLSKSPFAAAPGGAAKPPLPKIYQTGQPSPFGAA